MRISTTRWILGWAAVLSLGVAATGCKTGSSFSMPGSSWLSFGKKTTPSAGSITQPPSMSFSPPNSSSTPSVSSTASARGAGGSLGEESAASGFTAPQKSGAFSTGRYDTNPTDSTSLAARAAQYSSGQSAAGQYDTSQYGTSQYGTSQHGAGQSAPYGRNDAGGYQTADSSASGYATSGGSTYPAGSQYSTGNSYTGATPSGGVQKGFYGQDPGPAAGQAASGYQYSGQEQSYGQNQYSSYGQDSQPQANPYATGYPSNATADLRNSHGGGQGYGGTTTSGGWNGGTPSGATSQDWGGDASGYDAQQTQSAGGYGAPSHYDDPYRGTQSKSGHDGMAEGSAPSPMTYPQGLATESNFQPGSTSRNISTTPLYGAGDIQQAGYEPHSGRNSTASALNDPYAAPQGQPSGYGNGGYDSTGAAGGWQNQQQPPAATPQYPTNGGTWR